MTKNEKSTKFLSERQELSVAKAIGGKRTPMSGASKFIKGDVVTKYWLCECKTQMQSKNSFSIKKEWIDKANEEAFDTGKPYTAIVFNFGGEENVEQNYYVINERCFKRLVGIDT